ncbi:molybdenum cofactor biosynthesis protein [Tistrella bauzanensis]|uniref:Molybdenum cofactor biosynthesis protein n=1 Tax=Tistrella bauzanensis TaxID=657419 RepID=A0ABQ1IK46_9PROT|nr:competence/damage-inducible protein A [Tistrella bauzanensis]GGB45079.1 molybdenum cofactor biosynthesis protein [Tistrella bauzanensis]
MTETLETALTAGDAGAPRTAAILVIGNEILSGRTQDVNVRMIATKLAPAGIRVVEVRVVPDIEDEIVGAIHALTARADYLFTTGGIGPTHDDITAAAVARAMGVALIRDPEAERRLTAYYPPEKLTPARLRMANVAEGATLIDNPVSIAPGFRIGKVHVMAGVPQIAAAMMDNIVPTLTGGAVTRAVTIAIDGAEGEIAQPLGEVQARHPQVEIGSYPAFRGGKPSVSLVLRGTDTRALDVAERDLLAVLSAMAVAVIGREAS